MAPKEQLRENSFGEVQMQNKLLLSIFAWLFLFVSGNNTFGAPRTGTLTYSDSTGKTVSTAMGKIGDRFLYKGSENAVHLSETVELLAGQTVTVEVLGDDWVGIRFTVTELVPALSVRNPHPGNRAINEVNDISSPYPAGTNVWDLADDWSTNLNPNPVAHASWTYRTGAATYSGSLVNNFPGELPPNTGWTLTGENAHISLNKFTADAESLTTNFKAGEIGGHAPTGATWTTLTGGTFRIDYSGFMGRIKPLKDASERFQKIPVGVFTLFDDDYAKPIGKWLKPPIEKPDYPTDEFIILHYNYVKQKIDEKGFLGDDRLPYSYLNLLAENGIRGIMFNFVLSPNPELSKKQDKQVVNKGLNVFYIDVPSEGRWLWLQEMVRKDPNYMFWGFKVPTKIEDLSQWKTVNYLTETFPDCKVMLLVGGELENVQNLGRSRSDDHFDTIRRYISHDIEWLKTLKKNLKNPENVLTFEQSLGAAYPISYLLKVYDMAQTKTWDRQSMEINIANNRGTSGSYDRPIMMADDLWGLVGSEQATGTSSGLPNDHIWSTRSPEEMEQQFYLSYFSGMDYLYHEYPFLNQVGNEFWPNLWGQKYLDFGRFTATHPQRGRQIVKTAIMRGFGDTWSKINAHPDIPESKYRDNDAPIRDYQLLNVFFPKFGTRYQTDPHRFCTGTPYGPIDMIPWDTQLDKLKTYDLVFYFGLNAMDDKQYHTLKKFVDQGGKLVMALGQLRVEDKDPREILPAAVNDDFFGVKLDKLPRIVEGQAEIIFHQDKGAVEDYYELALLKGNPVATTQKDAKSVIIHNRVKRGEVWLYATDFISKINDEANINFFTQLAEGVKPLTIEPYCDWLEYTIWEKGNLYILPLFNHGRIRFPSGNGPDNGPWEGTITLALDKFPKLRSQQLEAYRVEFADPKFEFTPLPITKGKQDVSLMLTVDKRAEIIIGPKGTTQREFFGGRADAK